MKLASSSVGVAESPPRRDGIDRDLPEDGRRRRWLDSVGPHALVGRIRSDVRVTVAAIVVRPGDMTNDVVEIDVVLTDPHGRVSSVPVPVFARYRSQWSIDVELSVSHAELAGAGPWRAEVLLRDEGGRESRLPIQMPAVDALALSGYPPIVGVREWCVDAAPRSPVGAEPEP
jgi:hypothetical protein